MTSHGGCDGIDTVTMFFKPEKEKQNLWHLLHHFHTSTSICTCCFACRSLCFFQKADIAFTDKWRVLLSEA